MLHSKYIKFLQSIKDCKKIAPYYLLEKIKDDVNTITCKNIKDILGIDHTEIFTVDTTSLKKKIVFSEIDQHDLWQVNDCYRSQIW